MKSHPTKSGFALVIALSLMAFILLLLLSITTLTQVETRSAATAQSQNQARMNALLGLQQALGELQAVAGHDQRVTATGSLWEDPEPGTEHYVGVWSSEDLDGDGVPDGAFQRWLVSNNDADYSAGAGARSDSVGFVNQFTNKLQVDSSGAYEVTDENYVVIVGDGSVAQVSQTPDVMQGVAARKLPIESPNAAGHFAWWVGDNGVKATVTQVDPYRSGIREPDDWPVNANTLSMQGIHVGGLDDFSQLDYSDTDTVEKLLRTTTLSDLQVVESSLSSQVVKDQFHDLTTTSLGLQTNTRHGGLKRDLSLLFEMSDADFDDPAGDFMTTMAAVTSEESGGAGNGGSGLVYDNNASLLEAPWIEKSKQALVFKHPISGSASGDGVIYGPSFGMLRDYYRLYKGIENKATLPTLSDGWVHTYQPSKARVLANGNGDNSGNKALARARKYTLGLQGWRKYFSKGSPDTSKSSEIASNRWGNSSGDRTHSIRATKGSYTPYISRITNVFALTADRTGTQNVDGEDEYEFDIIWQPYIALHNPYNVRVESQRMRYTTELKHLRIKGIYCSYEDENGETKTYQESFNNDGGDVKVESMFSRNIREMTDSGGEVWLNIPGVVFEPGEVKVFSVSQDIKPSHGSPLELNLSADAAGPETAGIRLDAASRVDLYKQFTHKTSIDRKYLGADEVELVFKLEKSGSQVVDVWNPELNAWDALFSVTYGEYPLLFGNVNWDQGAVNPYRNTVDSYEDGAIASLVFDDYVKPLSFSESLGGGGTLEEVIDNRKVYPNFMLTNPMASSFHKWAAGTFEEYDWSGVFHSYAESFVTANSHPRSVIRDGSSNGSWGYDHGSNGPSRSVLIDLPSAPMESIGQFQHAVLHPMPYFGVKVVGNSFPSPFVAYDTSFDRRPPGNNASSINELSADGVYTSFSVTFGSSNRNEYCFYDFSYLLNDTLWDGYYFSSIAPDQTLVDSSYDLASEVDDAAVETSLQKVVSGFVDGTSELRNSRMTLLRQERDPTTVVNELQQFDRSAKHLAVSGSFNVNSTSVSAWKVLLSGYRASAIAYFDSSSVDYDRLGAEISAFPGMSLAGGAASSSTALKVDSAWSGFRELSDTMIDALAEAIVAQIHDRAKIRGSSSQPLPALSLGQFINRMNEDPSSDVAKGGTIQQAIVDTQINDQLSGLPVATFDSVNFNKTHDNSGQMPGVGNTKREYYPEASYSYDMRNVSPLALTQADILQAIGPVISARSDTFTVRSYGDVQHPLTGEVISRVWCEATVQRMTDETVDGSNERRFEIISFRWLTPEEV